MYYKRYLLILGLLIAIPSLLKCQDYIRLQNIGPIRKPFVTIEVSKIKIVDSIYFYCNIILDVDKYNSVKHKILAFLPEDNQKIVNDLGCFRISIRTKDKVQNYYLSSMDISVRFFRRFLKFLRKDNIDADLIEEIQTYLKRIGA
jgi:hypothetical protein